MENLGWAREFVDAPVLETVGGALHRRLGYLLELPENALGSRVPAAGPYTHLGRGCASRPNRIKPLNILTMKARSIVKHIGIGSRRCTLGESSWPRPPAESVQSATRSRKTVLNLMLCLPRSAVLSLSAPSSVYFPENPIVAIFRAKSRVAKADVCSWDVT